MDENRVRAYGNLIEALLNCPSGQEVEILQANSELMDAGLILAIRYTATQIAAQGNENAANRLRNLADQMTTMLEITISATPDEYFQFLMQVLRVVGNSQGNPQAVYPLLLANLDKLDDGFMPILQSGATQILSESEPEQADSIAINLFRFGNFMQNFPLGNKAHNMEIAIAAYHNTLQVFTREAFPQEWAMTQNNLGAAYGFRVRGKKAQNLEREIECYQNALQVRTREAFPKFWAETQNNLGSAYSERISGYKADNLERAIECFQNALQVRTREASHQDWAGTQNNLGATYRIRILGDKAQNLERAIEYFQNALQVRTREALPQDWAITQYNLGLAYSDRILGDKADNLERAVECFQNALRVYTRDTIPLEWAKTQNGLAIAYLYRIEGDRANNLERAIECCQQALQVRTREVLPQDWAQTQSNLGIAYHNRIRGEKADNMERAIKYFQNALQVLTQDAFPFLSAKIESGLANAYSERILGQKTHNIERAIEYHQNALQVLTHDAFPFEWAKSQNGLATAYLYRIEGDKTHNLERSIECCQNALQVFTRETSPQYWAGTQNLLALAYSDCQQEKAENLERVIECCQNALQVFTRNTFPVEWAGTQNNLANAYRNRIRGDRAQNLEQAIKYHQNVLQVRTREAFPVEWAGTQNNLANAYSDRILGDKVNNLERAIEYHQNALQVRTREAFPVDWAITQKNLANAYRDCARIGEERTQNLERAIECYQNASDVLASENFPFEWARAENNLANAYRERVLGTKAENLERAIASFQNALSVHKRQAFPQEWAMTQNNLGLAYSDRILGEKANNLDRAIECYQNALQIRTREAFPQKHADTLFHLGRAYRDAHQGQHAYNTFLTAINTVESLREEVLSGDESKQKLAEEYSRLYVWMVETCVQLNRLTEALEYAERSKTQNLIEQILLRDARTIFPSAVADELAQLRNDVASAQYQIQQGNVENYAELVQRLQYLRQRRNQLQDDYLPVGSSFRFDSFQPTLDRHAAIIEWYIASETFFAFIISEDAVPFVWQSTPDDFQALLQWTTTYLETYYSERDTWRSQLTDTLKDLAQILHLDELLAHLPPSCHRLILIPHRFLHLFPFHALPVQNSPPETEPHYLLDIFPNGVSYAPSCQLLQQVQTRQRPDFDTLFAIQTPTPDLYKSDKPEEKDYPKDLGAVGAIKKQFASPYILKKEKATKSSLLPTDAATQARTQYEQLQTANCLFFFCHGYFNPNSPLDSGLILADDNLTLAEIIAHFRLDHCRLVTLSACETGIPDFENSSDEYISLPYGFLLAGSTNVVSSLWSVDATATALLMVKFYEELQRQDNIILALRTAQFWLRDTTLEGFQAWIGESKLNSVWKGILQENFENWELEMGATAKRFDSPYYWSAFCTVGQGE